MNHTLYDTPGAGNSVKPAPVAHHPRLPLLQGALSIPAPDSLLPG